MKYRIGLLAMVLGLSSQAQEVLTRDEAVKLAVEYNYDIQVANKNVEAAGNNASVYNSGYLPTLSATGNAIVSFDAGENETIQQVAEFDAAASYNYNGSLALNYTIFDGGGRAYNYKQLKENHNLSELQARQIIENTLLQLSSSYFELARLYELSLILESALDVSQARLQRVQYSYDYGQATQLDVLNAEVDINNDSINLLNTRQLLENVKRDLNLIMGRDVNLEFAVDTAVSYELTMIEQELIQSAIDRNIQIELTNSQLRNSEFAVKASRAGWFPSLSANASYDYAGSENPNGAFLLGNQVYGPQAGLTLSWNIFDGGRTKVLQQNARISLETTEIQLKQTQSVLERDVLNANTSYQNALFVLAAQQTNELTAQRNFDRSKEMYKQGQISSIEFRQSQINLLNAQNSVSQSKYDAKNAELRLKQLAGILLE
jgi:outer membrane protein